MPENVATTPNPQFTIPPEILSGKKAATIDHGPFYFFSPAFPVTRLDHKDSVPRITPCTLVACTDWVERIDETMCPPGAAIEWTSVADQVGTIRKIGTCLIPAFAQANTISEMFYEIGVRQINSLSHQDPELVDVAGFNGLIYPTPVEPWFVLPESITQEIASIGGLEFRRKQLLAGISFIQSNDFLKKAGKERQRLYSLAADECLAAFQPARQYVKAELSAADTDIRLRLANAGGKPTYDPRDAYMQWLLAQAPINELQNQGVKLELPEGFLAGQGQGLSKEDWIDILSKVNENAVKAAQAAQKE